MGSKRYGSRGTIKRDKQDDTIANPNEREQNARNQALWGREGYKRIVNPAMPARHLSPREKLMKKAEDQGIKLRTDYSSITKGKGTNSDSYQHYLSWRDYNAYGEKDK